jgi:hypothetical protein
MASPEFGVLKPRRRLSSAASANRARRRVPSSWPPDGFNSLRLRRERDPVVN